MIPVKEVLPERFFCSQIDFLLSFYQIKPVIAAGDFRKFSATNVTQTINSNNKWTSYYAGCDGGFLRSPLFPHRCNEQQEQEQQQQQHCAIMTSAYGAIPQKDCTGGGSNKEEPVAVVVVAKAVDVRVHVVGVVEDHAANKNNASDIPAEARDLTWTDTYYADNNLMDGVIAVFDIDHEKIRRNLWFWKTFFISLMVLYGTSIFCTFTVTSSSTITSTSSEDEYDFSGLTGGSGSDDYYFGLYFGSFWLVYTLLITALVFRQLKKMSKGVSGLHVAVTKEGIRKDMNRYPFGNMFRTATIVSTRQLLLDAPRYALKKTRIMYLTFSHPLFKKHDSDSVQWNQSHQGSCCNNTGNVHIQSSEDDTWNGISGLTHNADAFVALVRAMIARNAAVSIIDDDVESQTKK
jgi:hypothetical protein